MKFTDKVRLLYGNNMDTYLKQFYGGEEATGNSSGVGPVTTEVAMKYSVVFACNRVLSETLASLPIMEYKKDLKAGTREPTNETKVYDILHNQPNSEMSPFNFKECCMTAINLGGNSVSERLINAAGDLIGLQPYPWNMVSIGRNKETNKLEYTISNGSTKKVLTRDQVFHIPGPSLDGVTGMSPIEQVASSIRLGLSYEAFGNNFYANGANSSGAFAIENELGEEAYNRLKKELQQNYTGLKNTGRPMLLEGGLKFQPFMISPVDAQLIENKRFQKEDIASVYRVPMHMVQDLSHATFSNIENLSLQFVVYTMLPHFKRWEENINMQLLTKEERMSGYFLEFKIDALLRGDQASRATAYAQGRTSGYLSVNDIRRFENMSPIPNGDIYLQPMNYIEAGTTADKATNMIAEEIYNMIKGGEKQ